MTDRTKIKTTKPIYPQIYAYTLPHQPIDNGWIKIGYTERKNVDDRINEQVNTAATKGLDLTYNKLWYEKAQFIDTGKYFKDKELHQYLRTVKHVKQRKGSEWFFYNGEQQRSHQDFKDFINHKFTQSHEPASYVLRDEQKQAVEQTKRYIESHSHGSYLWNAKPRFGKTLTTYDLVKRLEAQKVLVVTNRPAIGNSWFDDFEKFMAEQTNYAFVSEADSLKNRATMTRDQFQNQIDNGKDRMIAFISLQDLKGSSFFGGKIDKLKWVSDLDWDLLVIDESHEGVDTFKTDTAFEHVNRNFTLYLSGTPFKAVASGEFSEDQIFNWTYADEQAKKTSFKTSDSSVNPYSKLPQLNMFSYRMGQMITDDINSGSQIDGENIDFTFDLNEFFATNDTGKFIHESDVKKWMHTLTNNEKYPFSTMELRKEMKHTFWLLNRVSSAKALAKLLDEDPVFGNGNYKVILAAGDGKREVEDENSNQKSLDKVKKAIAKYDKTITLSVGQLTTGVTIPEWSGVMMLSNMKSPSQYMQAAFRAQNPWSYELNGEMHQKENAYVFDFAPERTLLIYDEFANNLSRITTGGKGTTEDRQENIKNLLNFFPVIAEDNEGKMVELDVNQVLTIPKTIKAQEVVKRGFMSNLLFQNISGIFASNEVREILEDLNPVEQGKVTPRITDEEIDTKGVNVDDDGKVQVDNEIVISKTKAHFGEKQYEYIPELINQAMADDSQDVAYLVKQNYMNQNLDSAKQLAKEQGISKKETESVIKQNAQELSDVVRKSEADKEIEKANAKADYEEAKKAVSEDPIELKKLKENYQVKQQNIEESANEATIQKIKEKTEELNQAASESILKKAEEKKKNIVEADVRARLRGFSRTIPSFLMAYGTKETNLYNFDTTIKDNVFKEVTGITLDQFRKLRDGYHFFDETVFNESVQEFLQKRAELANYFDENQKEDIFDYIPPQKTNQIFTPKKVVKMMVDKLQEQSPEDFKDPDKTFADLYIKSGLYLTEIVKRLYQGLDDQIPDENERLKHILEHQIYGFAPSEIIYRIARNYIFGFDDNAKNIDDSHVVYLDTTPYAKNGDEGAKEFEEKCDELFGGNE